MKYYKNLPHLIFYGSPGCGKTSTVHALAKYTFQENSHKQKTEMNASDERGINVIREKNQPYSFTSVPVGRSGIFWHKFFWDFVISTCGALYIEM